MNMSDTITSHLVPDADRLKVTNKLFGLNFPMRLEPFVFDVAGRLAPKYKGGFWLFYELSNGGFYMALRPDRVFAVSCQNGFDGKLSGDALANATGIDWSAAQVVKTGDNLALAAA